MLEVFIDKLDGYLQSKNINSIVSTYPAMMENLKGASTRFTSAAVKFQMLVDGANSGSQSMTVRQIEMIKSRLTFLERSFINPRGVLPNRPEYRHVVFASSIYDRYSGVSFSGVVDSLEYYFTAKVENNQTQATYWQKQILSCISVIQYSLESAIMLLQM